MRTKAAREEGPTAADFTAFHSLRSESGGEAGEGRPAFLHPPNFAMSEGTGAGGRWRKGIWGSCVGTPTL